MGKVYLSWEEFQYSLVYDVSNPTIQTFSIAF